MRFVQAGAMVLGALIVFATAFDLEVSHLINAPDFGGILLVTVISYNALLFVVTILVIIDSIKKIRNGMTSQLAASVFVVKLAAIPFFLINAAVLAFLTLGGMAVFIFGGMVMLVAAWIGAGLTYLALVSTSVYGWASVIQLRRERGISTSVVVLYSILLLVPVTDTLVGILLFGHSRRGRKTIAALPETTETPA